MDSHSLSSILRVPDVERQKSCPARPFRFPVRSFRKTSGDRGRGCRVFRAVVLRPPDPLGRRVTGSLDVGFEHREVREVSLIEDELDGARTGTELRLRPFEVRTVRIAR
jgi:hypothetical protein